MMLQAAQQDMDAGDLRDVMKIETTWDLRMIWNL
jgi:hypothetical protein